MPSQLPSVPMQSVPCLDDRGRIVDPPSLFSRSWWLFFQSLISFISDLSAQVAALVSASSSGGSQPYDLICSFVGNPGNGAKVMIFTAARAITWPGNLAGSTGSLTTNPTATALYTGKVNGTTKLTVSISTGGAFTFATSGGAPVAMASGDRLVITGPSPQDASLADVGFTLAGVR